jgi:hypothetical protein
MDPGKCLVFSQEFSSMQVVNTFGAPLFEGNVALSAVSTKSAYLNSIFTQNLSANTILANVVDLSSSYVSEFDVGNKSTIQELKANLTQNMIIAVPFVVKSHIYDGAFQNGLYGQFSDSFLYNSELSNVICKGNFTCLQQPSAAPNFGASLLGTSGAVFCNDVYGISTLNAYYSLITIQNLIAEGGFSITQTTDPYQILTYLSNIKTQNVTVGGSGLLDLFNSAGNFSTANLFVSSFTYIRNPLLPITQNFYADEIFIGPARIQGRGTSIEVSSFCVTTPSTSASTMNTSTLHTSTLTAINSITLLGTTANFSNTIINNSGGSLHTSEIFVEDLSALYVYANNVHISSLNTNVAIANSYVSTSLIEISSNVVASSVYTSSVRAIGATIQDISTLSAYVSSYTDGGGIFSNSLKTFVPSHKFAIGNLEASTLVTRNIDISNAFTPTIHAGGKVTFQDGSGTISLSTLTVSTGVSGNPFWVSTYYTGIGQSTAVASFNPDISANKLSVIPNAPTTVENVQFLYQQLGDVPGTAYSNTYYEPESNFYGPLLTAEYSVIPSAGFINIPNPRGPVGDPTNSWGSLTFPFVYQFPRGLDTFKETWTPGTVLPPQMGTVWDPIYYVYTFTATIQPTPPVILNAWYGVLKNVPGQGINVTTLIQSNLDNGTVSLVVNDTSMGYTGPPLIGTYKLWLDFYPANISNIITNTILISGQTLTFSDFGTSILTLTINETNIIYIDLAKPETLSGVFLITSQTNFFRFTTPRSAFYVEYGRDLSFNLSAYWTGDPTINNKIHLIDMQNTIMNWPYSMDIITIKNPFNVMICRNIFYLGSLNSVSDSSLKEDIVSADISQCLAVLDCIPLKHYKWTDEYMSRYEQTDKYVLGILATDVQKIFPKSVTKNDWATVDSEQLEMAHIGATKALLQKLAYLETKLAKKISLSKISYNS